MKEYAETRFTLFGATHYLDMLPCAVVPLDSSPVDGEIYNEESVGKEGGSPTIPVKQVAALPFNNVQPSSPWYMKLGAGFHGVIDPTYMALSMDDLGCHLADNTSDAMGAEGYQHLLSSAGSSIDDAFILLASIGAVFFAQSLLKIIYKEDEAKKKWEIVRQVLSQLKNVRHAVINVRAALSIKDLVHVLPYQIINPLGIAMGAAMVPLAIAAKMIDNARDEAIDLNRKLIKEVMQKIFELDGLKLEQYLDDCHKNIKRMTTSKSVFMYVYSVLDGAFDGAYLYGCFFVIAGLTLSTAGIGGVVILSTLLIYTAISIIYKVYNEYKRQQRFNESADEASIEIQKLKYNKMKQEFLSSYGNDVSGATLSLIHQNGKKRSIQDCQFILSYRLLKLKKLNFDNVKIKKLLDELGKTYKVILFQIESQSKSREQDDIDGLLISCAQILKGIEAGLKLDQQKFSEVKNVDACFNAVLNLTREGQRLDMEKEKFRDKYGIKHGQTKSKEMLKASINNFKLSIHQFAVTYFSGDDLKPAYELLQEYMNNCKVILELEKEIYEARTYQVCLSKKEARVSLLLSRNETIIQDTERGVMARCDDELTSKINGEFDSINERFHHVRKNQELHIGDYCRYSNWFEKSKTVWYVMRSVECVVKNVVKVSAALATVLKVALLAPLYLVYKIMCWAVTVLYGAYSTIKERTKHNPQRFSQLPHFFSKKDSQEIIEFAAARRFTPEMI